MVKRHDLIPDHLVSDYCKKRLSPPPLPAKLFMGLIMSNGINLEALRQELIHTFGEIEDESPIHAFDHTDYYNREMGPNLMRCFLGFNRCIYPDHLAQTKRITNRMEIQMGSFDGEKVFRLVNLDPGILTLSNVILATTKNRAHRIYLGGGIYAEVTLLYSKSLGWYPLDWTYPDYRTPLAKEFFQVLRNNYYTQIKAHPEETSL